ncbi:ABC transporter permease [Nocardioides sp. BYT-33-1]|uniref:ABC transporter permease n=1 Tax=Nocardioides sp. BYT-33-1 TaxID=3416952 RepID=UPI003F529C88
MKTDHAAVRGPERVDGSGRARWTERTAPVALGVAGVVSLLLLWQLLGTLDIVPRSSLPGPWSVLGALPTILGDRDFLAGAVDSAAATGITVLVGSLVAVAVGLVASSFAFLQRPTMVVVNTFRSVPATALIPIGVLIFGLGMEMKVSIGLYAVVWPILINTIYGVATTEPMRRDVARSLRWGWWRQQAWVTLPSALPSILTGVRVAVGIALVVVISTELLGARYGVGTVLVQYTQASRPEVVYAGVLLLGTGGALLFSALVRAERRLVRWVAHD